MHYTGTIWRPPYESGSLLLEAAAGCTHHRCKFCTLYDELPFRFRLSPLEDIEADLAEAQELLRGTARPAGLSGGGKPLCASDGAAEGHRGAHPQVLPGVPDHRLLRAGDRCGTENR